MKPVFNYLICIIFLGTLFISCKKDPETVTGCTDPLADNFNPDATVSDTTCLFVKRFLGEYTGDFKCKGAFASVFTMADLSITELLKNEVIITIKSSIGPLPVMGKTAKNEVTVDATLQNLTINPGDIIAGASGDPIKADGKVKTVLSISSDNKTLTGNLNITLITKEPTIISGFPIPAGFTLMDDCGFTGVKK